MEVKGSPSKYPFLLLSPHWAIDNMQPEIGVQGTHSIGVAIAVVTAGLSVVFEKINGANHFEQLLVPLDCPVLVMLWLMAH